MNARSKNRGFTLVELAMVIAVIGILFVTISMGGPRLMENAQGKALMKRLSDTRVDVQAFVDRFRFMPGDFPATNSDFAAVNALCVVGGTNAGNGNGLISASESNCVSEHLSQAGFNALTPLDNGILYQVVSNADAITAYTAAAGSAPTATLPARVRNVILVRNVRCDFALAVDNAMDDGNLATGNNVVSLSPACTGATPVWLAVALQ